MPSQRQRSRSWRKVKKKLPGGRLTTQFKKRKPSKAKCGSCGKALAGVARASPVKLRNMSKSKKRSSRPFGGTLCSPCTRKLLIAKVRNGVK